MILRTADHSHSTQQLRRYHGWIRPAQRVAANHPAIASSADRTVNEKALLAVDQNDVANVRVAAHTFYVEKVAGPDDGKHAGSPRPKTNTAPTSKNFDCETALLIACLSKLWHRLRYEALRLKRPQLGRVGSILPQARAIVSKTFSKRNSGF